MFHYRVFGCLEAVFATAKVAIRCTLFTNCCISISRAKTVADYSQTVAFVRSCDALSRRLFGIRDLDERSSAAAIGLELSSNSEEPRVGATPVVQRFVVSGLLWARDDLNAGPFVLALSSEGGDPSYGAIDRPTLLTPLP
jgi:hypothetical protein